MPLQRCPWFLNTSLEIHYHDQEWGVPQFNDATLFEFLVLESMQAGLSWSTILNKRENYRLLFDHFDAQKIALYDETKISSLMFDARIIRSSAKIKAIISHAHAFLNICEKQGSFSHYFWNFSEGQSFQNQWHFPTQVPSFTPLSYKMSKDMKHHGFTFFGPKICYAFMQAMGMVNDHLICCFRHSELTK